MKTKNYFSWAVALVALCVSFTANAQLQENQKLINFSLGFGSSYAESGFKTVIPPFQASYEVMIKEKISVGGFVGMSSFEFETPFYSSTKFNYFNLGGMVNYHFSNDETWNFYGGARLGYTSSSVKSDDFDDLDIDIKGSGVLFGVNLGARYHVSEKLAIHSELGYGISVFEIGVTYKL